MSLLLLVLACSTPADAPATPAAAPALTAVPKGPPPTAECLDKADLADGTADHAVHHCANCGLGMPGDAGQVSEHAGYTFHSCSESCKKALDADPGAVLARACKST